MEEFKRMITMLHAINSSELEDRDDDYVLKNEDSDYVEQIEWCANALLITEGGEPDFKLMDTLWHNHGFFVFPTEKDRFGWLGAAIQTKKGIITFG
jgi:hypothetical protein